MRETQQSGGRIWKILAVIIMLLMVLPVSATAAETGNTAFTAYRASVVPTIDGKISPGEWGDAEPYYHHYEGNRSYNIREDGNLSMAVCLKYDTQWMYILFVVNDDDNRGDFIAIHLDQNATDCHSGFREDAFMIAANGTAFTVIDSRMGISPNQPISDGSIRAFSTYMNGTYVFEVAMRFSIYFHGTYSQPFWIEYMDPDSLSGWPWEWFLPFPKSGLSFSPDHYTGEETIYDIMSSVYNYQIESERIPYSVIMPMTITILASAGILVAIFREIRKNQ